jgi:hypothetical protein
MSDEDFCLSKAASDKQREYEVVPLFQTVVVWRVSNPDGITASLTSGSWLAQCVPIAKMSNEGPRV